MSKRTLQYRRRQLARAKYKALRKALQWESDHPLAYNSRWLGVQASTHSRPCSCFLCKSRGGPSMQERRAAKEDES